MGEPMKGFTVWLTGLSASGKSTISDALKESLLSRTERAVYVVDGDYMRRTINRDLGYSRADRNLASERIAHVARLLNDNGVICIVSNISQDRAIRSHVRGIIGEFVLVFVDTPVEVCMQRDYKGNYAKAMNGDMKHMVGVDEHYERPDDAELVVDTCTVTPEEAAQTICAYLEEHGMVP